MARKMLSPRQAETLELIRVTLRSGGAPTIRELGVALGGIRPNGVMAHIKCLERKGYITRGSGGEARSIRIVGEVPTCPHCGGEL